MARSEAREASRERDQRHGVSRNGAAIDAAHRLAQARAGHRFDRGRDLALHGMIRRDIALRIDAHRAGETDEARVFARAIVVQGGRRPPRARKRAGFVLAERPMRAAFERPFIVSRFGEHRARGRDMVLASRVRGAAERNLLVAETQAIRGAACDKRQGLQRLDGGARINRLARRRQRPSPPDRPHRRPRRLRDGRNSTRPPRVASTTTGLAMILSRREDKLWRQNASFGPVSTLNRYCRGAKTKQTARCSQRRRIVHTSAEHPLHLQSRGGCRSRSKSPSAF